MKNLVFILLIVSNISLAQNKDCDKSFFKNKTKKKSSVFNNDLLIKTKYCTFVSNGNRSLSLSFIKDGDDLKLQLYTLQVTAGTSKRAYVLGQNIRIGLIFEDGTNEIIKFDGSPQRGSLDHKVTNASQNEITLSEKLLDKFSSIKLVGCEIQNPFNTVNTSKVRSYDVKSKIQNKIINFSNCFKARITK